VKKAHPDLIATPDFVLVRSLTTTPSSLIRPETRGKERHDNVLCERMSLHMMITHTESRETRSDYRIYIGNSCFSCLHLHKHAFYRTLCSQNLEALIRILDTMHSQATIKSHVTSLDSFTCPPASRLQPPGTLRIEILPSELRYIIIKYLLGTDTAAGHYQNNPHYADISAIATASRIYSEDIEDVLRSRMEELQIPRRRRVGGSSMQLSGAEFDEESRCRALCIVVMKWNSVRRALLRDVANDGA